MLALVATVEFAWLQEKDKIKKEKEESEAKFKHALVDDRKEQVCAASCPAP